MYDYLQGRLALKKAQYVVVDVGGVGYRLEVPLSTFRRLPEGGNVKLFTYLKVSDDDLRLYGFASEEEREVFVRLVGMVAQLGPSKALAILSAVEVPDLRRAVEEGDVEALQGIRGIGSKIANRLMVELKGKLPESMRGAGEEGGGASISKDAVEALVSLGYLRPEAEERVRRCRKDLKEKGSVEELLRRCLATA